MRYIAHFSPEAWINDYAVPVVPVDAEGPTEWDCTRAVSEDQDYFDRLLRHDDDPYDNGVIDNDDMLRSDPDAPDWVRDWRGPFTIRVRVEADSAT